MIRVLPALLSLCVSVAGSVAAAEPPSGPVLAAASRFGQTERPDLLQAALRNGMTELRDEIYWERVEQGPGQFVFDQPMTQWPAPLGAGGGQASLIVNHRHAAHDGGDTPHSTAAMRGQAAFVAAAMARFPAIRAVEVGNEVNSPNFLAGPVREAGLAERAGYHVAQLAEVQSAAHAQDPGVRVLGGGVHSIPIGYLAHVAQAGGAAHMDALALHPYDTPPEHFGAQIAELRAQVPEFADMPVEVTEFGLTDSAAAPGYLMRYYCEMALAGVTHAVWYPLAERGDGLAPLLSARGAVTPVGRTFKLLRRELEGRPVQDMSPDAFTRVCLFGADRAVIWGAPRSLTLAPGLVAFAPDGAPQMSDALQLSQTEPLLIRDLAGALTIDKLRLGAQLRLADSFWQYGYPRVGAAQAEGDGFARFGLQDGVAHPLVTHPGQERGGVPWVPYRAAGADGGVRLLPEVLIAAGGPERPFELVHAYEARAPESVVLEVRLAPSDRSLDGVRLEVRHGAEALFGAVVTEAVALRFGPLDLARGERLEIAVGPNGSVDGDDSRYRFVVLRAED